MLYLIVLINITFLFNTILTFSILTRKKPVLFSVIMWSFAWIIGIGGAIYLIHIGVKNRLLFYLLNIPVLLASILVFRESFAQKVFVFFTMWQLSSFITALCKWVIAALLSGRDSGIFQILLFTAIYSVIIPSILAYWNAVFREALDVFDTEKPVYAVISLFSFVLFVALFGTLTTTDSLQRFIFMILFQLYIALMYYLLFSHFRALIKRIKAEHDLKGIDQLMMLQKRYYEEVEKSVRQQQKHTQDSHNHLKNVSSLVKAGDLTDLSIYINQLLEKTKTIAIPRYCVNSAANAIINGYIQTAKTKGIEVSLEIDLPELLEINDYELSTVLGNGIENAIEMCERIRPDSELFTKRFLKIRTKTENDSFLIRIENSCNDNEKEKILTTKITRGFVGLDSIRSIVNKYQGRLSFKERNNVFILTAIIPREK